MFSSLALALLLAQQPEKLLAEDRLLAEPLRLEPAPARHSTVFRGQEKTAGFNLHSYLAWFAGRFWAIWSSSAVGEEDPDQQVLYATSRDGHTWSAPAVLAADPDGPQGPARWIARGIWVEQGRLTALAAYIESADYGQRGRGTVWKNLSLRRFEWNGSRWLPRGVYAANCMNNFPPERLGGTLSLVCRDENMTVTMALWHQPGQWRRTPISAEPPFDKMDEPTYYTAANGDVQMLVRDNARSRRLLRAISRDAGRTWSKPVVTNYPDATSKNFPGRLSTGEYFLISNPNPAGRDPLAITFSRDGQTFDRPWALRKELPARRFAGRAKGSGTAQYPHAIEHGGSLWVIYSTNKEDIEIAELPLAALEHRYDVVVLGGTPGGIAAALAAGRAGRRVALVENHARVGGMTTNGLGKSDIETREAIGGLFREFTAKVFRHYIDTYGAASENAKLSREGYYYEPSVAQRVLDGMLAAEPNVRVFVSHRLEEVLRQGRRVTGLRARHRSTGAVVEFRGRLFIDATYEGDLFAAAGARYRLGRESRAEFNELHAGVIYQDYETRAFLPGSTGEADGRLPAYTYRLCLTSDPANAAVLEAPPPDYDRRHYLGYLDDWKAGRLGPPKVMKDGVGYFGPTFNTVVRALSIAELPNRKTDVNMNPRPLGFPFAEWNAGYPEATWDERDRIETRLRNLTLGLLYFLQNDEAIPAEHRALARRYHLAKDEFTGNGHFPDQLYVREARRLVGLYTLTENDTELREGEGRTRIHADAIAAGEFPIDSFPTRRREPGHDVALEGYVFMLDQLTKPYQIPYRVMVPESVDGLLVPVAASTTHVAFSTVRLEPTWMALGQAAGVAAHLALEAGVEPRAVAIDRLQRAILARGQVITYFKDLDRSDPAFAALQFYGAKGFFPDYFARSRDPLDLETARRWWRLATGAEPPAKPLAEWLPGPPATRGAFCQALYDRR